MPVILLRNIDADAGLCNGTRLILLEVRDKLLSCRIATGTHSGETVFLPRMDLEPSPAQFPIKFTRTQFPIKPAFAMTINKSQAQTLGLVGVFLKDQVFTHGQLYVALSRVGAPSALRILCHHDEARRQFHTANIVFPTITSQFRL